MTKKDIFPLSHLVLYAKGWYKQTDNIWEDLKEILKLDDYTPFTNSNVFIIILGKFEEFNIQQSSLREVLLSIHPKESWKVGYYTKDNYTWSNKPKEELVDYDMPTAFIYHVLSTLRFLENSKWNPKVPKYKLYPKNPKIKLKTVIEHFNRKLEVA